MYLPPVPGNLLSSLTAETDHWTTAGLIRFIQTSLFLCCKGWLSEEIYTSCCRCSAAGWLPHTFLGCQHGLWIGDRLCGALICVVSVCEPASPEEIEVMELGTPGKLVLELSPEGAALGLTRHACVNDLIAWCLYETAALSARCWWGRCAFNERRHYLVFLSDVKTGCERAQQQGVACSALYGC